MSRTSFEWNGDALIACVRHAAIAGANDTVDATRDDAKETHEWRNDERSRPLQKGGRPVNTHLERKIVSVHADTTAGDSVVASVGFKKTAGFYGLFHEEGTVEEHEHPALRPAADRQFPAAAERTREHL